MKKFYLCVFTMLFNMCISADESLSWHNDEETLRQFRTFQDVLNHPHLSHTGVQGRHLSGSAQFSGKNLFQIVEKVQQIAGNIPILIIDTRLESHGFINDIPVYWKVKNFEYNEGKDVSEILEHQKSKLAKIAEDKIVLKNGFHEEVHSVATEEELATAFGCAYLRLPTRDHTHPSDQNVDDYLALIKNHPDVWLHIHCSKGKGRTTTLMAMYDMFYNAKVLALDEILDRQKAINGQDFYKYLHKPDLDPRKKLLYEARLAFIHQFYKYCKESDPQKISWQAWLQTQ